MTENKKEEKPEFEHVHDVLSFLQQNIVAPKSQYNHHGKYNYRSCEDITEAVKKLMPKGACILLKDEIVAVYVDEKLEFKTSEPTAAGSLRETIDNRFSSGRIYVKATATLSYLGEEVFNVAFAREPAAQKGTSPSQITGAASSYARKYALAGLFMLDDVKDEDKKKSKADEWTGDIEKNKKEEEEEVVSKVFGGSMSSGIDIDQSTEIYHQALKNIAGCSDMAALKKTWTDISKGKNVFTSDQFSDLTQAKDEKKQEIETQL